MNEQYYELITPANNSSIELSNIEGNFTKPPTYIIDLLAMWGDYHRYISRCGFKRHSAFVTNFKTDKNTIFIEQDIDLIDTIILKMKNSLSPKQQQQYAIIEAYYKGIDLVIDGYDWSQKLTIREISELLNLPKSTVSNRKKQAEQYITESILKQKLTLITF
ncbi:hypothetical protein RHO12_06565 [Orbus sturtevantii]|uniref:hypothetical protein n=1 Tax=Orbus sturtevantii TaxID=3074109 RepID=UPI00370D1102